MAGKSRDCRIRAPRALRRDALRRVVVAVRRRNDLIWRLAVFDPVRQSGHDVMRRVAAGGGHAEYAADRVGAEAPAAMLHPLRH